MSGPLTPERRAAIEQAIRDGAGHRSAGSIAKEIGCSRTTVTKVAGQIGMGDVFDRSKTANAAKAKQADNRSRRAAIVDAYLADAEKIRLRLWEPAEMMTPMGEVIHLTLPGARDVRDFAMAGTALIKASIEVEKHDAGDQGSDDAKSMLLGVATGLQTLYRLERLSDDQQGEPTATGHVGDPV